MGKKIITFQAQKLSLSGPMLTSINFLIMLDNFMNCTHVQFLLTLLVSMEFLIKFDIVKSGWFIVYMEGHKL